jgi:hypothetical protein
MLANSGHLVDRMLSIFGHLVDRMMTNFRLPGKQDMDQLRITKRIGY